MLLHTCVKLVARGQNVARHVFLCGPLSLKFKLQRTELFWNSSGLNLFTKENDGLCHVICYFSHLADLTPNTSLYKKLFSF